jgi:hypothetical protein
MTADPTPAADPRLAELTKALLESRLVRRYQTYFEDSREARGIDPVELVPVSDRQLAEEWAAAILALLPARTATTEAATLAAAVERAEATWAYDVSYDRRDGYTITCAPAFNGQPRRRGQGPTLPDAIAAALAATGGEPAEDQPVHLGYGVAYPNEPPSTVARRGGLVIAKHFHDGEWCAECVHHGQGATTEAEALAAAKQAVIDAAVAWKYAAETGHGDAESWAVYTAVDAYAAALAATEPC